MDGREPATVTEHEYDTAGRLVRSITTSEPRWTDQDRAEALALAHFRDGLCPLCRRPLEVCTSMEGVGPDFAAEYTACRATMAILSKQRAVLDGKKPNPYAPAFLWAATTRE